MASGISTLYALLLHEGLHCALHCVDNRLQAGPTVTLSPRQILQRLLHLPVKEHCTYAFLFLKLLIPRCVQQLQCFLP